MTLVAAYNPDYGRVTLTMSGAPADADYAIVQHSPDGITWETIRGGDTVPLSGGAGTVDDLEEFEPGTLNQYRAKYVDSGPPVVFAAGTAVTGNNASITPPLPAGVLTGDLLLIGASIRNSGTGIVNVTALNALGWYTVAVFGNIAYVAKRYAPGVTAPLVTFTGGVANADTMAQMIGLRNADDNPNSFASFLNPSAQNMAYPSVNVVSDQSLAMYFFWKQDDWTSISPAATYSNFTTTGDDAAQAFYAIGPLAPGVQPGGTITVTGGASAISRILIAVFPRKPYMSIDTTTITPNLAGKFWFKIPARPGANKSMEITLVSEVVRRARTGRFDVLGRTNPVAVTDVQSSREFTIEIDVKGYAAMRDWDNRLASGDPVFIQAPDQNQFITSVYAVTGDVTYRQDAKGSDSITFVVPLFEVAKPGPDVYGNSYIWNDVLTDYADWTAVLAAKTSWSNLISTISNGVIVVP